MAHKGTVAVQSGERLDLFVPTTKTIVLLAELMVVATGKDFKLEAPQGGFILVKYPDSFQATIVQTTNIGYDAFNDAQKSMSQIVLYAERANALANNSTTLILTGEPDDIEDFLPLNLEEIEGVVTKCANLTAGVVAKFNDVISILREVLASGGAAPPDTLKLVLTTSQELEAVRNQWLYLAAFFQKIVDLVKDSLANTISNFVLEVQSNNDFAREKTLLANEVGQISGVANKIRETAIIYSEVSQRYLLRSIMSLQSLAGMNPAKDGSAITRLRSDIKSDCTRAEEAITNRTI